MPDEEWHLRALTFDPVVGDNDETSQLAAYVKGLSDDPILPPEKLFITAAPSLLEHKSSFFMSVSSNKDGNKSDSPSSSVFLFRPPEDDGSMSLSLVEDIGIVGKS